MIANTMVSREHRAVFLEKLNKYVQNKNYNEETLNSYAQQILFAFPESRKAVEKILDINEPVEPTEQELERQQEVWNNMYDIENKFLDAKDFSVN